MLEVRELYSGYGAGTVLHGVSLSVERASVVALLGRNGMGKTSLIRSVMGLAPPAVTGGDVHYRGRSLLRLPPHRIAARGIGLVPQGRRLFASLTVLEHLQICPKRAPQGGESGAWTVERVFELFPQLASRRRHRGNQLSGGERQMLAIARALMLNPELLLMDEPSEGLAPVIVEQLQESIVRLREQSLAILLVEQNLTSALAVADRVFVLETGRVVYEGAPAELRADRETLKRYLGV